jgi:hypothetical protein
VRGIRPRILLLVRGWRVLIGIALFVPACTVATFTNEERSNGTDADVAILNNRWGCPFCIGWIRRDGTVIFDITKNGATDPLRLAPGNYVIFASYKDPYSGIAAGMTRDVALQAGHVYTVHKSNTAVLMFGHFRVWISDDTEDRIVADSQ